MLIDGSCHCGSIKFEAAVEPDQVALCHCLDCQQLTGSAYRVTVTAAADRFKLTAAIPKLYVKHGDNGRKRKQYFCGDCGSPIYTTGEGDDAEVVGIRIGIINQRHQLYPSAQIWCSSALPWVDDIASLPKHQED